MRNPARYPSVRACVSLLLGAAVLLSFCSSVLAQGRGGGLGRPPRPEDPGKGGPKDDGRPTGSESGYIMKYETPKEGDDEDIQAYVTLKPPAKGAKPIKVRILRSSPPKIELGDKKEFDPEVIPEILTKGLYCRFSWKITQPPGDKKKAKLLDLTNVAFDNLEVSGKIDEIRPDLLVIRCKPKNDRPWPDAKPDDKKPARSGQTAPKPKPIAFKKLKLKVLEDVTQFRDADNHELDPADFEANQTVDALVVYGRKGGIVLNLKSPTPRDEGEDDSQGGRSDSFRSPPYR
ncbi:MAG: hypothetical protein DCC65_11215 [Planctomycetota bacterium]|nr:MAG: hypothetical protein DCC65_11215 [Planctomycetota bacterium]